MGNNNNTIKFEYKDFLELVKQNQQNQQSMISQQQHLQQYSCMILNHKNKLIEGICMNETCKQENRRTCVDCITEKIHDKDHRRPSLINSADKSEGIIQEFKKIINQQIDSCQFQLYFEYLYFCDEVNPNRAYNMFEQLSKINDQIQQILQQLEPLNFQQYQTEQQDKNIGLFQYLQDYQRIVIYIHSQILQYKQKKKIIYQGSINKHQLDKEKIEQMEANRKKEQLIINSISKSNEFQIGKIRNDQKEYLIKKIEDINNTIDEQYQDLILSNHQILFKLYPKNSTYYFEKGINKIYIQSHSTKSKNVDYYVNSGYALEYVSKYQQDILIYEQAIQLEPKNANLYYKKGNVFRYTQQYDQAILMYEEAIKLNPLDGNIYFRKGNTLEDIQEYEQAIFMYNKSIQLDPNFADYYIRKAYAQAKQQTNNQQKLKNKIQEI